MRGAAGAGGHAAAALRLSRARCLLACAARFSLSPQSRPMEVLRVPRAPAKPHNIPVNPPAGTREHSRPKKPQLVGACLGFDI